MLLNWLKLGTKASEIVACRFFYFKWSKLWFSHPIIVNDFNPRKSRVPKEVYIPCPLHRQVYVRKWVTYSVVTSHLQIINITVNKTVNGIWQKHCHFKFRLTRKQRRKFRRLLPHNQHYLTLYNYLLVKKILCSAWMINNPASIEKAIEATIKRG